MSTDIYYEYYEYWYLFIKMHMIPRKCLLIFYPLFQLLWLSVFLTLIRLYIRGSYLLRFTPESQDFHWAPTFEIRSLLIGWHQDQRHRMLEIKVILEKWSEV